MLEAAVDQLTAKISSAPPPLPPQPILLLFTSPQSYCNDKRTNTLRRRRRIETQGGERLCLRPGGETSVPVCPQKGGGGTSSPSLSDPHFLIACKIISETFMFPSYLHIYCVFKQITPPKCHLNLILLDICHHLKQHDLGGGGGTLPSSQCGSVQLTSTSYNLPAHIPTLRLH